MTRILRITDGTDTIDFESASSGYTLLYHTPAVAMRDPQGSEMYTRVVEELGVSVSGSSRAQIVERVQLLTELIDRAQRLMRGENIDPVISEYQVEGSTLAGPLSALVTGPPPGESAVMLPALFDSAFTARRVGSSDDPLVWRFERRGAWLVDEEASAGLTNDEAGATVHADSFSGGDVALPSPLRVRMRDFADIDNAPYGILVFGVDADHVLALEAEALSDLNFSVVDESGNLASGGDVQRCSSASGYLTFTSGTVRNYSRLAFFIVARSSASDTSWSIYCQAGSFARKIDSRPIEFNATVPTPLALGIVENPGADNQTFWIQFERLSGSGSIDVDYVVIADAMHPSFAAVAFPLDEAWDVDTEGVIEIDHKLLQRPHPLVAIRSGVLNPIEPLSYRGASVLGTMEDSVVFVAMLSGGSSSYWRYGDSGVAATFDTEFYRRPAYLAPR